MTETYMICARQLLNGTGKPLHYILNWPSHCCCRVVTIRVEVVHVAVAFAALNSVVLLTITGLPAV